MPTSTLHDVVSAIYGRVLTRNDVVGWDAMDIGEREAMLAAHEDDIAADLAMITEIVDRARADGVSKAWGAIRNAEGIDADAIDEILETATAGEESGTDGES